MPLHQLTNTYGALATDAREMGRICKFCLCRGGVAPLYTVVSMAPDDEVVNHVDLPDHVVDKSRNTSLNSMAESDLDSPHGPTASQK